jgi:HPr kinase/phosphorylase
LVSDDAVQLMISDKQLMLATAPNIAGKLEVRGVGICATDALPSAPLRLVAELVHKVERLPLPNLTTEVAGFGVPALNLVPFEISAAIKLEYALRSVVDAGRLPVPRYVPDTAEGSEI